MRKFLSLIAVLTGCMVAGVPAHSAPATPLDLPEAFERAQVIRAEVDALYRVMPGRKLAVREATTTGVIESFTLLTADLRETRTVPADNGIYFAICPRRATCHSPHPRFAWPAADFLPRRLALELALRTFLETSASVVAVSLPTPRSVLFVVERDDLAREVRLPALAEALNRDLRHAPEASLRRFVEQLTRPRVFVFLDLVQTPSGRETLAAMPRWPDVPATSKSLTSPAHVHGE
jgi:hypothetical protein